MNALTALLRERIAEQGPMSFHDFMEAALYHPEHGYYSRLQGFGALGDFVTSPETHPVFGALLARQATEVWERMGRPPTFTILEFGAGSGSLAAALLEALRVEQPALAAATRYAIEERSPSLRAAQEARLRGWAVTWGRQERPPNLVVANEVLDALPVHRIVWRGGGPRELCVGLGERDEFVWVETEDAPAAVKAYFARLRLPVVEGGVVEVNLGLRPWAEALAGRLAKDGLALVLDYGYLAEVLFARPQGTLLTYYRHTLGSDPLERVGEQDISCHVDFTTLATAAAEAGLRVLGMTTQAALLRNLGMGDFVAAATPQDRGAMGTLVDREGLGRIRALFLARGLDGFEPTGLAGGRAWPKPGWVPERTRNQDEDDFLGQWREAFGE